MSEELFFFIYPAFCPHCKHIPCICNRLGSPKKQSEPVRIRFVKNAKGSGVTRVEKLSLHPQEKEALLKKIKKALGCGGTIKDGALEIQGDKKPRLQTILEQEGYKVRVI